MEMNRVRKIPMSLAAVLKNTYLSAMNAREAVEHRITSIPMQEAVVRRWEEDLAGISADQYPGHDLNSYPVQTRKQREIEKLERYQEELPKRLSQYAAALNAIEETINDVEIAASRNLSKGPSVQWPCCPSVLIDDRWPSHWPPPPIESDHEAALEAPYTIPTTRLERPARPRSPKSFTVAIANQRIDLDTLYEDGAAEFMLALNGYLHGDASSRWPAIIEAVRCGIRWPQLDRYLVECPQPWLPQDFVGAEFGLRGTLNKRHELADLLARVTPAAGRWYLSSQPGRTRIDKISGISPSEIAELMSLGLMLHGPEMPIAELLRELPFPEVKSAYALVGLRAPKGFNDAVARFSEIASARGEETITQWIRKFVDPSRVVEVCEPNGWHREDRLGPRARANVLVSTLVMLHEGENGPLQVINWGK